MATKKTGRDASAKRRKRAKGPAVADRGDSSELPWPPAGEEHCRPFFELVPDPLLFVDNSTGRILAANAAASALYGYTCEELLTLTNTALSAEPEATRRVTADTPVAPDAPVAVPMRLHRKKDGTVFPVEVALRFFARDGRAVHLAAIRDTTERQRVEAALRASEERFRSLYENTTIGLYRTTPNGEILLANPALVRMLGYSSFEDLRSRDLARSGFEPSYPRSQFVGLLDREGEASGLESAWQREDGTTFFGRESARAIRDAQGKTLYYDGTVEDVTERRQAEIALKESEERLRDVVSSVVGWVWEVDEHGVYTYSSHQGSDIFGRPAADIVGKTPFDFMPPDEAKRVAAVFSDIVANKAPIRDLENWNIGKDGERICLLTNGVPVLDSEGRLTGYRGVDSDITCRKRAEAEKAGLEARTRHLQRAESLGRMAGAIAHHFNNQLSSVLVLLELAKEDLPRDSGPARDVAEAMLAAERAAEMSTLMLTYLGQTPAARESLDLSIACGGWLSVLADGLPKHVVLEADLASPGPHIHADAAQVRQVLASLVANAWEASGAGRCVVRVTVKAVASGTVPHEHRMPPDWQPLEPDLACLEVVDHGCGVAGTDIERIFDPFYSTKFAGRGLGLAVVLGIVRAHGGGVTVESAPGGGSAIRVYFPVSQEAVPVPE